MLKREIASTLLSATLLAAGAGCSSSESRGDQPVIGRACAQDADCGDGYQCYLSAPGGYCQLAEPNECLTDDDCPTGTVCAPRVISQRAGFCLLACNNPGDCREGYLCHYEELFPGEGDTPKSSKKVCFIPCVPGLDQLCNDNPIISSLHGSCNQNGTCTCHEGFDKNPETGRCL